MRSNATYLKLRDLGRCWYGDRLSELAPESSLALPGLFVCGTLLCDVECTTGWTWLCWGGGSGGGCPMWLPPGPAATATGCEALWWWWTADAAAATAVTGSACPELQKCRDKRRNTSLVGLCGNWWSRSWLEYWDWGRDETKRKETTYD